MDHSTCPKLARRILPPALGLALVVGSAWGQTTGYVHHWSTTDGGGLILSTGGPPPSFRVSGTVGQPDAGVMTGGAYRLIGGFWGGAYRAVTSVETGEPTPLAFRAASPRPNPSRGRVLLSFDLPASREVTISIFDLAGRLVRSLRLGALEPGPHSAVWDGTTAAGTRAGSGIYFTRIRAGEFSAQGRVILLSQS